LDHLDLIETATKSKGGSAQLVDTVTTPAKSRVSGVSPVLLGLWPPFIFFGEPPSRGHPTPAAYHHILLKVPIFDDVNSASLTKNISSCRWPTAGTPLQGAPGQNPGGFDGGPLKRAPVVLFETMLVTLI